MAGTRVDRPDLLRFIAAQWAPFVHGAFRRLERLFDGIVTHRTALLKHGSLLVLSLLVSGMALAQADPRLATLEAALNRVQLEQQSVYQQFLMAQELRRNELQESSSPVVTQSYPMGRDNSRPVDYDESVRLQRERQERLQRYDRDIARAYARHQELGVQKKALLDQIMELSQPAKR